MPPPSKFLGTPMLTSLSTLDGTSSILQSCHILHAEPLHKHSKR